MAKRWEKEKIKPTIKDRKSKIKNQKPKTENQNQTG